MIVCIHTYTYIHINYIIIILYDTILCISFTHVCVLRICVRVPVCSVLVYRCGREDGWQWTDWRERCGRARWRRPLLSKYYVLRSVGSLFTVRPTRVLLSSGHTHHSLFISLCLPLYTIIIYIYTHTRVL